MAVGIDVFVVVGVISNSFRCTFCVFSLEYFFFLLSDAVLTTHSLSFIYIYYQIGFKAL